MTLENQTQEEYDKRFSEEEIKNFKKLEIKPQVINQYNKRFNFLDILQLISYDISSERANKYSEGFNGFDICKLVRKSFPKKCVKKIRLNKRFCEDELIDLIKNNISLGEAYKFDGRFDGYEIVELSKKKIDAKEANRYDKKFGGSDVLDLLRLGLTPEQANKYHENFSVSDINMLNLMGITPEKITEENRQRLWDALIKDINFEDLNTHSSDYIFLGIGNHAITFLQKEYQTAWKFSQNIRHEYNLLKKLYNPQNVVQVKGDVQEDIAVELEYVNGKTLEQLCQGDKQIGPEKVVKYSAGILNGLSELRQVGIYHRDLNDRNVLIDEEKDRAVIIDLGAASENPNEVYAETKAYGGNNDLISVGQLIYKMRTGNHLFKGGPGLTHDAETREEIFKEREEAYKNPTKLQEAFAKVRKDVPGELGEMVVKLLDDDLWKQPSLEKVLEAKMMFERYVR